MAPAGAGEAEILRFPSTGDILVDPRGGGRWMRVNWHDEAGLVVLSLWRDTECVGTMRIERAQVPALIAALVEGLAAPSATP